MMMYIIIGIACLVGIIVVVLLLPNSGKQQQKGQKYRFELSAGGGRKITFAEWWENRTDQPGAQYHFIITDRLFLWCNAPISLSFFVSLCRKYCVLTVNFEK